MRYNAPIMSEHSLAPRPERTIAGRYRLRDLLGLGGMAEVYLAYDLKLEREVALKRLRPEYARWPDFRARFLDEARLAAQLNHPNIVTVYDVVEDDDTILIVMEYVPGSTLAARLKERGPLPLEEALHYLVQACAGLGYAHRAGLVHGDVKPQNLLIAPGQRVKVADFGLARVYEVVRRSRSQGVVWGSPPYLSPEHARGEPLLPASDVYSLGVVLYQALTGHFPFTAQSPREWLIAHREATPLPPREYNPEIPPRLEQVLLQVLSKEPRTRFRTADQFGRVLLQFTQRADTRAVTMPAQQQIVLTPVKSKRTGEAHPRLGPTLPGRPFAEPVPQTPMLGLNWDAGTWALAVLAVLAVLGLIPLWLWVYYLYHPPGP